MDAPRAAAKTSAMSRSLLVGLLGIASLFGCSSGGGGAIGGSDASTPVDGGASTGSGNGSGNSPTGTALNGCTTYLDQTDPAAARKIDWSPTLATSPNRCMKVKSGQTVAFEGRFTDYPIAPAGGAEPSPFASVPDTGKVKLGAAGVYGFACTIDAKMTGAIQVE